MAKALAHPLRVRILGALEERVASPKEIATELDASLGVVSYHVRMLADAGLVELVETKRRRGAIAHYYRLTSPAGAARWEPLPDVVEDELIGAQLADISVEVNAAAGSGGFRRSDAHLSRSPLVLDEQAFAQVAAKLEKLLAEIGRIGAAAERRLARCGHQSEIRAAAVLMLFEMPLLAAADVAS